MDTGFFRLSTDYTVDEYELIDPPKENHLREDQMNRLWDDSRIYSLRTEPILCSRKEMTDEEFELYKEHTLNFFEQYIPYIFSTFSAEHGRFYNAYCWSLYKEKKKVMIEPSYFEKLVIEWRFDKHCEEKENEKQETVSEKELTLFEKAEEKPTQWLHVFDEKQMELRLKMYEEALYARHVEHYYEQYNELPEPDFILEKTKDKVEKELNIIKQFIANGQQCKELAERIIPDDCFFSFEDEKFLFYYGKSIYKFTIIDGDFYLKGEKVDLSIFFQNLRQEQKRIWKHAIRLGKLFERKGIPYCNSNTERLFYLYRVVDEQDLFYIRYKQAEMNILWDKRNFYRMNGDKIEIPAILVHEMVELDGSRKKAQLKAKHYFQMFLTKEEKERFLKTKSVLVEGKNYRYVFCPEITVNSVIRIDKVTGERKSMCVMFDDPYIPRYDVIASALLMVKTGQEGQLNAIANTFKCGIEHQNTLKKLAFV